MASASAVSPPSASATTSMWGLASSATVSWRRPMAPSSHTSTLMLASLHLPGSANTISQAGAREARPCS